MAEPEANEAETMDGDGAKDKDDKEPLTDVEERRQYDELHAYLLKVEYPPRATKVEKGVIRKRSKKFLLKDGVLHYRSVGKDGQLVPEEVCNIVSFNAGSYCSHYN